MQKVVIRPLMVALVALVAGAFSWPSWAHDHAPFQPCWRTQSGTSFQHWSFNTGANPTGPELSSNPYGAPLATVVVGPFGSGWNLGPLFCTQTGLWDLGSGGTITLDIPNEPAAPASAYKYVWVQVTEYFDGTFFQPSTVSLSGATLLGSQQFTVEDCSSMGLTRKWNVNQTKWLLPSCPSTESVVISNPNGALIDQVVVDTLCLDVPCPTDMVLAPDAGQCDRDNVTWSLPPVDGCKIASTNCTPASGSTFPTGPTPVNCTITDGAGRVTPCSFTVTITDGMAPIITCPGDATVDCVALATPANTGSATATDNCDLTPAITHTDVVTPGSCPDRLTITRTWKATDDSLNMATCVQTITVNDQTAPGITCPPAVTVNCASQVPAVNIGSVTAMDNCGGAVTVTFEGDVISAQTCANRYTITRTYKATDECGNMATCTQTITVNDQTVPMITGFPADLTVSCTSAVPAANDGSVTATDNCGGTPTITHDADVISSQTCANRYTISRVYHATDECGNVANQTQTITVNDQTAPVLAGVPANVTVACNAVPPPAVVTANDNCDGSVSPTFVETAPPGSCTIIRTWTATDVCGNASMQSQTITVDDMVAPGITCPAAMTVTCASQVPAPNIGSVGTTDNCPGPVTVTFEGDVISAQTCTNRFTLTRTYKAADACGNMVTCMQVITVNDQTAPSIACPAAVTVTCASLVPAPNIGGVTASDTCDGAVTVTHEGDVISAQTCANRFTLTRTYKATDACGNMATCTQIITVNDQTAPTITLCPANVTVNCSDSTLPAATGTATATDNCAPNPTVTFSDSVAGTCPRVITRTWTATDACGNVATCQQIITATDPCVCVTRPVSWWKGEGNANDSADGNHGSLQNGASFSTGLVGLGFITDGIDDYVHIPDSPSLRPVDLTIEGWFNFTVHPPLGTVQMLVGKAVGSAGTFDNSFAFWLNGSFLRGSVGNAAQGYDVPHIEFAGFVPTLGQWYHLAYTFKDSTDTEKLYINGAMVASFGAQARTIGYDNHPVSLGSDLNAGLPDQQFPGRFDEVAIYSQALTDAEILTIYNAGTSGKDGNPPVITCPANTTATCATFQNTGITGAATAVDNCALNLTVTFTDSVGAGCAPMVVTRTWKAMDCAGNMATCVQIINVTTTGDGTLPNITCPPNMTVECGTDTTPATTGTATGTDNCQPSPTITFTDTMTNLSCPNVRRINRTWRATDCAGNERTCVQTITLRDTTPPIIICPLAARVACSGSTATNITGTASATDTCDTTPTLTFADSISGGPCPAPRTITRTWTATDDCNNMATCQQIITASDACFCADGPSSIVGWWKAEGNANDSADANHGILQNGASFAAGIVGQAFITDGVDDYVRIADSPSLRPVDLTIEGWVNFTVHPNAGTVQMLVAKAVGNAGTFDNSFVFYVNGTFLRGSVGNAIQGYGPPHVESPGFVPILGQWYHLAYTFHDASDTEVLYTNGQIAATFNGQTRSIGYDTHPVSLGSDLNAGLPDQQFPGRLDEIAIYSRALLPAEILSIFNAGVSGKDYNPPVLTCPANRTASCNSWTNLSLMGVATATDDCDTSPTITFTDSVPPGACSPTLVITRTWRAVDCAGNTNTCAQTITLTTTSDSTLPNITCPPNITVQCGNTTPATTGTATATDNCRPSPVITFTDTEVPLACPGVKTITRTWKVTDCAGNMRTCAQTITVRDTTPPMMTCPANLTVQCFADVPQTNFVGGTVTDNCGTPAVALVSEARSTNNCAVTLTRTYRATDVCGNITNCTQTILVHDTIPPVISCAPATVPCASAASTNLTGIPVATDNCDTNLALTFTDIIVGGPCPAPRTITRTWTATDDCGNNATCQQVITAADGCFCGVAPAPIAAWWRGEGNANDSADGNHGTLQNGVTFAPGAIGQAFSLDGVDDYVGIPDSASLRPVSLTMEGWYNFTSASSVRILLSKALGASFMNSYVFWLENGVLRGHVGDNIGGGPILSHTFAPTPGQWYHLAFTFDDTTDTQALYVNGALGASGAQPKTISYDGHAVTLGTDFNSGTPSSFFHGRMDEVSMYPRALTGAEIMALFSNGNRPKDYMPPTIICPANRTAQCDTWTNLTLMGSATATDNCDPNPVITLTETIVGGPCASNMVVTRTWKATDCVGNMATCTQTINVNVAGGAPPALTCPTNMIVECGSDTSPAGTGMATGAVGCGSLTITHSDTEIPGTNCPTDHIARRIVRTWRATDQCGNTNTCTQTITVRDTMAPTITCPPAVTVECAPNLPIPNFGGGIAMDNCGTPMVTHVGDVRVTNNCIITVTRTYRATDGCGNTNVCSSIITVRDTTPPTMACPANTTVQCFSAVPAPNFVGGTGTDNCGSPLISHIRDALVTNLCVITITRTYRGIDACGNTNDCAQIITVQDTTAPVITCPTNMVVECGSSTAPGAVGSATAIDNCDTNVTVTFTDTVTSGLCPTNRVIARTWTATDRCGNTNTCAQIITVRDTTAPVITCPPNITIACNASTAPGATGTATAIDNCDTNLTMSFTDNVTGGPCPTNRVIIRTWTATDACGHSATCQQMIFATDDCFCGVGPASLVAWWKAEGNAASSVGTNNGTLQNGATFAAGQIGQAFSLDGINDHVTVLDSPSLRPANLTIEGWFSFGATNGTRTLVSKAVGNGTLNSYMLRLNNGSLQGWSSDNNGTPAIVSLAGFQPLSNVWYHIAYTLQDSANTHILYVNGASVASGTTTETIAYSALPVALGADLDNGTATAFFRGLMDEVSIYPRALSAAEILAVFNNGNRSKDYTPPVIACPPNVTAQCGSLTNLAVTGTPTATDNCDPKPMLTFTDSVAGNLCQGTMVVTRTWRAADCAGNTNTCTQTITVRDTTAPAITCPPPVTVECNTSVLPAVTGTATAVDNCDTNVTVTFTDSEGPGSCPQAKIITRTWKATDCSTNMATCAQIITVRDTTAPAISCPANVTLSTAPGQCSAVVSFLAPATDNCDTNPTVTCMPPSGATLFVGVTTVTCTATDDCGNTRACTFSVTVADRQAPEITCPANVTLVCTSTNGAALVFGATTTDNCDASPTITCTPPSGSTFPLGTNSVTCEAADDGGNTKTCSFTVTVKADDAAPPVLSIRRQGTSVVICWTAACAPFQLQAKANLDPLTPWEDVIAAQVVNGNQHCVTLTIGSGNLYFRLEGL